MEAYDYRQGLLLHLRCRKRERRHLLEGDGCSDRMLSVVGHLVRHHTGIDSDLHFVPKYVRKYQSIKRGVNEVKRGNLDYKIPVTDNGELDRSAMSINEISEATSLAVQNELKNQRMKTDLISNVSHDLKTPLTSMVSYVDLLKDRGFEQ